jgi:DNA-binding MarR family transcriptional regulator
MSAEPADPVAYILAAWADELPEIGGPTLELSKRAARLGVLLDEASRRALAKLGLTDAEYGVLATLRRSGEPYRLTPTELSRALLLSSGGTSNVMHRLVAAGLVEREADPADGRSTRVRLTAAGVRTAEAAVLASTAAHKDLLSPLSEADTEAAVTALRRILQLVEPPPALPPTPPSRSRANRLA